MATVIMQFEVKDYQAWWQGFEAARPHRTASGCQGVTLYRDSDDPGVVFGVLEWDSADNARAYFGDAALKAKMMDAGVVGVPAFHFVKAV